MASFEKFVLTVLVAGLLHKANGHPADNEPMCTSRFDYEAKLLERMIVVEHKIKLMEERSKEEIQKLNEAKLWLEDQVDFLKKQLTEEQRKQLEEMEKKSQEIESNLETKLAEISRLSAKNAYDQKAFLDEVTTSLETAESRLNSSISAFAAEAQKPAVAFYMRYTGNASPGTNAMLTFNTPIVNTNSVYNTQTGHFTAPTSGVYMFSVQICGNTNKYINFRIYVNDDMISDTTEYDQDSAYHCTSTNAVAILNVGDRVCVKTGSNTSSGSTLISGTYRWSTFMGTLVH